MTELILVHVQELIHLAIDEPGDNFTESQYNGIDLAVPMQWAELLPDKGLIQVGLGFRV